MSKPIPDDIMARAREAADELHLPNDYMHGETVKVVAKAILAAVEEETEACAAIADTEKMMRERLFEVNGASINANKAVQAEEIASAIRARKGN